MNRTGNIFRTSRRHTLGWILATFFVALLLLPGIASAHAKVAGSTPADGSTVEPGLTQVTINFTEELGVDTSSARLVGSDGSEMSGVSSTVDRAERTKMVIQTPALTPGRYTVKWTAFTPDDNATTNGTLAFTVNGTGTGTGTGAAPGIATSVTSPDASTTPSAGSTDASGGSAASSGSLPSAGAGSGYYPALAGAVLLGAACLMLFGVAFRRRSRRR